jgi:Matrixin
VREYERKLSEYNTRVSSYNDQGGAPAAVFDDLERTRADLDRESQALNESADELNALADEVNAANAKSTELVESYNQAVEVYNKQYGYEKEFTQGDFDGSKINIYKFSDTNELVTVLVHEFGHALGIGHVDDASSVMYYLLGDTNDSLLLSQADKDAFQAQCGTGTELPHKVRAFIRSAFSTIM